MALSSVEMLGTVPLGVLVIVTDVKMGFTPWKTWVEMRRHYFLVGQYPSTYWRTVGAFGLEFPRWSLVLCAFILFAFFGFADEARQHYRLAYTWFATKVRAKLVRGDSASPNGVPARGRPVHIQCS